MGTNDSRGIAAGGWGGGGDGEEESTGAAATGSGGAEGSIGSSSGRLSVSVEWDVQLSTMISLQTYTFYSDISLFPILSYMLS